MNSTKSLHEDLTALFPAKDIAWRAGSVTAEKDRGRAVPSLRPVAVQDRLDKVVGPENWGVKYRVIEADLGDNKVALVVCSLSLYTQDRWVTKDGSAELMPGSESGRAVNAAMPAAFTRAAGMWGVGRYLQGVQADWAALDGNGHFVVEPALPAHLLPEAVQGTAAPEAARGRAAVAAVKPVPPAAKPAPAPAATKPAAAPAVPEAPVAEAPVAAQPGPSAEAPADPATGLGSALADAMAKLEGKALEMAKNVVERAKAGTTPIGMLRNYLNGDSAKNLLADDVRTALAAELDTIEVQLKAAA